MADIPKDQEDKFTWGHGDIHWTKHGEGPTLAEIQRRHDEAERAAEGEEEKTSSA